MTRRGLVWFVGALLVTVLIAVVGSRYASSEPDGLEYVAEREGFADQAQDHTLAQTPLADYGDNLGTDRALSTGIAGLIGVIVAIALGFGLFWLIRAPGGGSPDSTP